MFFKFWILVINSIFWGDLKIRTLLINTTKFPKSKEELDKDYKWFCLDKILKLLCKIMQIRSAVAS